MGTLFWKKLEHPAMTRRVSKLTEIAFLIMHDIFVYFVKLINNPAELRPEDLPRGYPGTPAFS
jgi:hypothetical protein